MTVWLLLSIVVGVVYVDWAFAKSEEFDEVKVEAKILACWVAGSLVGALLFGAGHALWWIGSMLWELL